MVAQIKPTKFSAPIRKSIIITVLVVALATIGVVAYAKNQQYQTEQQNLRMLDDTAQNIRAVYNKNIALLGDNVSSTSFTNRCREGFELFPNGIIYCGPVATITLKQSIDAKKVSSIMEESVKGTVFDDGKRADTSTDAKSSIEANLSLKFIPKLYCDYSFADYRVSYNVDVSRPQKIYFQIGCDKIVPNDLPGYSPHR